MNVLIIGGNAKNLDALDAYLMELTDRTGVLAFNVIGGYIGYYDGNPPLSAIWAKHRGYPYYFYEYKDVASLMHGLIEKADYAFFVNDGNQMTKRFMMAYKDAGKHGEVINV